MSESESGEASGLLVSESSSMAGYGGGGGGREEGGSDGEDVVSCRVVGRRECCGRCLLGRQTVEASPAQSGGAVAAVGDRDGQAASRAFVDRAVAQADRAVLC
jgi:hypothetical protein